MVHVELVFIAHDGATIHEHLSMPLGATVADVLDAAELSCTYPDAVGLPVGIFAKKVALTTPIKEGDRVEIYRPLLRDPKEKRRQLARVKK